MQVAEVMTRGMIADSPGDSMRRAAQLMLQYDCSGFPGAGRGKLIGMVIEGDACVGLKPEPLPALAIPQ
jgi:predicted transcriptional regulator